MTKTEQPYSELVSETTGETPSPTAGPEEPLGLQEPWRRYRLSAQADERHREGHRDSSESPFEKRPGKPKQSRFGRVTDRLGLSGPELALVALSTLGLLASVFFLLIGTGASKTGVYALVALIPLAVVAWVLLRVDRVAPLPSRYFLFSALWGAGVATLLAAMVNSALYQDFILYLGDVGRAETLAAVAVAPISEELLKGLGVIVVSLLGRKFVVTVANGVAVGGLVGAGFAFTENLIYFANAHSESAAVLGFTIFGRAVMSPFVHPLATSLTGIAVASAILASKGVWGWTWRLVLGFFGAAGVHALWNWIAGLGTTWILVYIVIEVPVFIAWLVWVLRRPRVALRSLRKGLVPYEATGWIASYEVSTICDLQARKFARRWARKTSKLASKSMRNYLVDAGRLGLEQVVLERTGPSTARALVAKESLSKLISNRELFLQQAEMSSGELGAHQPPTSSTRSRRAQ